MREILTQRLAELLEQRAEHVATLDRLVSDAEARDDQTLTDEEAATVEEVRRKVAELDERIDRTRRRLDEVEAEIRRREELDELRARLDVRPGPGPEQPRIDVRSEPRTYRPDGEHSWVADMLAVQARSGDWAGASERLARHDLETRDVATTAFAGAIPPQYLLDQFAPLARAGRPFADAIGSRPLPPEGASLIVPRVTTGVSAAPAAENAPFSETDTAVTDITVPVRLVAGQQDVSLATVERGGAVVDQIIFPDLLLAAETVIDDQLINGTGTGANVLGIRSTTGINSVAYTDATPTVPELWPKIADAVQRVGSNHAPATHIVMHPRRWGWIAAAVDTSGRPLGDLLGGATVTVFARGDVPQPGIVGQLFGLPVIADANIPTNLGTGSNEDVIIVVRAPDLLFMEAPTLTFRFEQTLGPQTVRVAVGRFIAFTAARYPARVSVVGGTGLVTPAF